MASFLDRVAQGAHNLLINCGNCAPGHRVLLISEEDSGGFYDPHLAPAIHAAGDALGLIIEMYFVPFHREVNDPDETLMQKINDADCTLFLARLGDQIRFHETGLASTQIINYALDRDMLASSFGTIDYQAFESLGRLINKTIEQSESIRVTCPVGTHFEGHAAKFSRFKGDTTRKRFPISVFAPIPAKGFRGRIAQNGFLTGTGSQYYSPWHCPLEETLFVNFEGNRITGFDGTPKDVAAAKMHYEFVGNTYGIDTYFIHSWHAGIHPGCEYRECAGLNYERWSGCAFGNPRLMHFHTCGEYPPGEISLNLLDPTVSADGVPIWEAGRLYPERLQGGSALLEQYPDMRAAFDCPATQVGQSESGQLAYV
ncbi:MAG: hypothetical protein ABJC87_16120 [Roseobacter sp.]